MEPTTPRLVALFQPEYEDLDSTFNTYLDNGESSNSVGPFSVTSIDRSDTSEEAEIFVTKAHRRRLDC